MALRESEPGEAFPLRSLLLRRATALAVKRHAPCHQCMSGSTVLRSPTSVQRMRPLVHRIRGLDEGARLVPEGRLGEVKDIVEAVLYLEFAPFVTGEILHVDGGSAAGVA